MQITNEVFAFRSGERLEISDSEPTKGRYLAVQLRSILMPPGKRHEHRQADLAPVEQCAVIACERVGKAWQWTPLGTPSKEAIGDFLMDQCRAEKDKWYFVRIIDGE